MLTNHTPQPFDLRSRLWRVCAGLALAAMVVGCNAEKQQKPKVEAAAAASAHAAAANA
jgi:hypothetical protein